MSTQSDFKQLEKDRAAEKQKAENDRKKSIEKALIEKKKADLRKKTSEYKKEIESEKKRVELIEKTAVQYAKDHPSPRSGTEAAQLDGYINAVKNAKTNISSLEAKYKTALNELNQLTSNKSTTSNAPQKPGGTNTTDNNAPQGQKAAFTKDYKYNAPMVNSAYFGTPSFVDTVLDGQFVDKGKYEDARRAWQGTTGGRGTIQMDQRFLSSFSAKDFQGKNFDLTKYGFKFLYNPQTVSMAWGLIQEMDPYYEATGLDKFQVVATALLSSTVSFEILLNRIEDFNYLGPNGLKPNFSDYSMMTESTREQSNLNNTVKNPYPETVPPEDLKEIYNKGTMYDLEYLFKVINGPNASFQSDLNGKTADRGWMKPVIMELHLGNALRYRVRISEFSVNHVIFNPRMVPVLSTVKLTFSRFADGDVVGKGVNQTPTVNSGGGTNTTPSGLNKLRNTVPGYGR